jgi:hypothetical protein
MSVAIQGPPKFSNRFQELLTARFTLLAKAHRRQSKTNRYTLKSIRTAAEDCASRQPELSPPVSQFSHADIPVVAAARSDTSYFLTEFSHSAPSSVKWGDEKFLKFVNFGKMGALPVLNATN